MSRKPIIKSQKLTESIQKIFGGSVANCYFDYLDLKQSVGRWLSCFDQSSFYFDGNRIVFLDINGKDALINVYIEFITGEFVLISNNMAGCIQFTKQYAVDLLIHESSTTLADLTVN